LPAKGSTSRWVQNSPSSGAARQRQDRNFSTAGDTDGVSTAGVAVAASSAGRSVDVSRRLGIDAAGPNL
jgi:hypothetical protein